jgi:hypothetical protein
MQLVEYSKYTGQKIGNKCSHKKAIHGTVTLESLYNFYDKIFDLCVVVFLLVVDWMCEWSN